MKRGNRLIKKFTCEYYQVVETIEGENREALFDFQRWATELMELTLPERTHVYKGDDTVRIEQAYFHPTYQMFFTSFIRGRVTDVPYLARNDVQSEPMILEDGQYVSEDVTSLFDPTNNILMIQKNSHSVSPVGIEQYLNNTTPPDVVVRLRKIIANDSFDRARRAQKCRKIVVRLADIQTLANRGVLEGLRSSLGRMVRSMEDAPSPFLEFTFSVGRDRGAEIDETEFEQIIDDIERNPIAFDRAKMSVIEVDETKMNTIDLFLEPPRDEISFEIRQPNNPIRFDAIMDQMGSKYCPGENFENRRATINRYLRD